jgi:hypothetical protein
VKSKFKSFIIPFSNNIDFGIGGTEKKFIRLFLDSLSKIIYDFTLLDKKIFLDF